MPTFMIRVDQDYSMEWVITNYTILDIEADTLEEAVIQAEEQCEELMEEEEWEWDDFDVKEITESSPMDDVINIGEEK